MLAILDYQLSLLLLTTIIYKAIKLKGIHLNEIGIKKLALFPLSGRCNSIVNLTLRLFHCVPPILLISLLIGEIMLMFHLMICTEMALQLSLLLEP